MGKIGRSPLNQPMMISPHTQTLIHKKEVKHNKLFCIAVYPTIKSHVLGNNVSQNINPIMIIKLQNEAMATE